MGSGVFRTKIVVDVLSTGPYVFHGLGHLRVLAEDVTNGDCSGTAEVEESKELTMEELHLACDEHGSDITFFSPLPEKEG
jgi:hypothetical protein